MAYERDRSARVSSGSHHGFTPDVESAAHLRQSGLCALCGTSLAWGHDYAVPVFPIDDHPGNAWKKEVDNCMVLCNGCWTWARIDDVHSPLARHEAEDFKFSHGRGGGHREWATRMNGRS
jgi:hypothetical protein